MKNTLSRRGTKLASSPARADMDAFMEAMQDLYEPVDNPEGKIVLNVAENHPMTGIMRQRLKRYMNDAEIPEWVSNYTAPTGYPEVLDIIAAFMRTHFQASSITADNISISAGVSAVLEVMSFVLCDPEDYVLIPAPAYPMYSHDLGVKSGVKRYDFQYQRDSSVPDLRTIEVKDLAAAQSKMKDEGKQLKMVLLTTPDNPTGEMYTESQLRSIATWCIERKIHLVVNEIYHLSVIYGVDIPVSFARVMGDFNSPYLHHIYGFSKDLAMSGLRVGVFHSLNEEAILAIANTNIPHMVSNLTQWAVAGVMEDDLFMQRYLELNRKALKQSRVVVVEALESIGIPYVDGKGSLFVWADFSKYLKARTVEAEKDLWMRIYRGTGVLLTPGIGFGHQNPGWFRIVYTSVDSATLEVAMARLRNYIGS